MRKTGPWKLCIAAACVLCALAFTPLVIPPGEDAPTLLGMPRALWAGFLVYALMVAVTWIGVQAHPALQNDAGKDAADKGGSGS